ncbi:unnamed protein product [Schistosoma turkestanicum]|nr:unnamed protein product [Schistosoma turkestanicum]
MGNCMKTSNRKHPNEHFNNDGDNLPLCKPYQSVDDINKLISLFTGDSNELNQCMLKNDEEVQQLKSAIQALLHGYALNTQTFHSISEDSTSNDSDTDSFRSEKWDLTLPTMNKIGQYEKTGHTTTNTAATATGGISHKLFKSPEWPMISTHILGFTVLKSNLLNCIEWLEYDEEMTHTKIPTDQLPSIHPSEQPTTTTTSKDDDSNASNDENDTMNEVNDTGDDKAADHTNNDETLLPVNRLCYTMFICQTKSDANKFLKIFQSMKKCMHSLEVRTGCKIRLSKCLFMYKGNLVRILVIDGPSKEQIVQCYTSLPQWVTRLLILEKERPNAR